MSKSSMYESARPILAQLHRGQETVWSRRYASVSNAFRRAIEIGILQGHPNDVVEVSSAAHGYQIGVAVISVNGGLSITFNDWVRRGTDGYLSFEPSQQQLQNTKSVQA